MEGSIVAKLVIFLLGMLAANALRLIARFFKIKSQRRAKNLSVSLPEETVVSDEKNDFPVLSKMKYFLASNDDVTGQIYSATPLQDSNPKDMA
ncbi:MAG: hypothetical protein LBF44_01090 [Holosporaceae bacterium]|jgi:hypothetical protein|nr:hypothetical protein [Holosporaceae bacterium]